jgi:hypothetical protein
LLSPAEERQWGGYKGWSWTFTLDGGNDGIFCGLPAKAGRRCG